MSPAGSPAGSPRLRLLLVYDTLYPDTIGGIEHRAAELARALAARGHRVSLAAFTDRPASSVPGVELLSLGSPDRRPGIRRGGASALRFAGAVGRLPVERFDLVEVANVPFAHLLPLALRCRRGGVPLLVTWHEVWGEHWRRFTPSRVASAALRVAEWLGAQVGDAVHAVSALTAGRLESYRRAGPVQVIPNGIDGARVRSAVGSAPIPGPPMVCAGRLFGDKRVELAIGAAAILARRRPGPLLTVIGEGPEEESLRSLAERLGIAERVIFTGKLPDADAVWRVAAGARIALHPSAREGFGIFPLEAMALGLPVVFCPEPGNAVGELVRDGHEGFAVAAEAGSIAAAASRLLDDAPLLGAFSAAARRRAAEFDWTSVAGHFEDACERLVRP